MAVKILTVDDSKTIRLIVARAFKAYDCEMFEAANGVEGLAVAAREKPAVILLDITMPVMDGTEMLVRLKGDPALKAIPVLMLTAESGRQNVLKIAKMGIRDYIIKPFKEDQLIGKVERVVNLQNKSDGDGKTVAKTLADPALILVVDDKPAILQQIAEGLSSTPWVILGKATPAEALEEASRATPDAVFISLSLNDDAGLTLFQQFRMRQATRGIPIFGMCIKTDTEIQNRAEQMGFTGIITKPLDLEALKARLIRTMNIDTSLQYFSLDGDIQFLSLSAKVTSQITADVERYLQSKINEMADSGMNKFILDLSKVTDLDVSFIKTIISILQSCQELGIRIRVVGDANLKSKLRGFQEVSNLILDSSVEEAKKLVLGQAKGTPGQPKGSAEQANVAATNLR